MHMQANIDQARARGVAPMTPAEIGNASDLVVTNVEIIKCDGGFRELNFLKVSTADGVVGWSEFDEWFCSPGVSAIITQLARSVVGKSAMMHERVFAELSAATRAAPGGVVAQAMGAIENALLDAKGRALGVPCYTLLGGKLRDTVRVYWSHCSTWRINHPRFYQPAVRTLADVRACGQEVRERGFGAMKSNLMLYGEGTVQSWHPGFAFPFKPELPVTRKLLRDLRDHLEALRDGAGPDVDLLVDLNFNAKTAGFVEIIQAIADLDIFWVEIDNHNPDGLAYIRSRSPHPISSCETLIGVRSFLPYLRKQSMDVAIVDAVWNGVWQAKKIADAAEANDVNIAPHNFYSHLSTMMNGHFAAAVPNFHIMELDVDRLPWEHELFDHEPELKDGCLVMPSRPGWGITPNEEALRAHPPRQGAGMASFTS